MSDGLRARIIGAIVLLALMIASVLSFQPPIWALGVAPSVGMLYYILKLVVTPADPKAIIALGLESIMATVITYSLIIILLELTR